MTKTKTSGTKHPRGRPQYGPEKRVVVTARVTPATAAKLRELANRVGSLGLALDALIDFAPSADNWRDRLVKCPRCGNDCLTVESAGDEPHPLLPHSVGIIVRGAGQCCGCCDADETAEE